MKTIAGPVSRRLGRRTALDPATLVVRSIRPGLGIWQTHLSFAIRVSLAIKWSCTHFRSGSAGLTLTANSNSVYLRHPKLTTYRCSLPGLTGFIAPRRAGPGHQRHLSGAVPTTPRPRAGIQPRYSGLRVQGTASSPSSTTASIVSWPLTSVSSQIWRRENGDVVELLSSSLPPDGVNRLRIPPSRRERLPLARSLPLM